MLIGVALTSSWFYIIHKLKHHSYRSVKLLLTAIM